jgi:3-hydroxyisobutyrate dehydrogenase-like beta-hydroxyacid dehydrogenase
MKKIGVIGLGIMGGPMAQHLIKAGFEVHVYNRTAGKSKSLEELGAKSWATPAELARNCEAVLIMVKADADVREVVLGPKGVLEGAKPGLVILNGSTILPSTNIEVAAEAAKSGVEMIDCPVTGSGVEAKIAKLTFMVGGKKELFDLCQPLFNAMGKASYYLGEIGTGSKMKLANNALFVMNMMALCESLTLASKIGIDPEVFLEITSMGGARSAVAESRIPKIIKREFAAAFTLNFMYKDLGLIGQLADQSGVATPVLAIVKEMIHAGLLKGYGQDDVSGMIKWYEEVAGIEIKK